MRLLPSFDKNDSNQLTRRVVGLMFGGLVSSIVLNTQGKFVYYALCVLVVTGPILFYLHIILSEKMPLMSKRNLIEFLVGFEGSIALTSFSVLFQWNLEPDNNALEPTFVTSAVAWAVVEWSKAAIYKYSPSN